MIARISLCLLVCGAYTAAIRPEVEIITEPRPGEEYVLVSSGQQTPLRNFETSHKIPEKHPNHRVLKNDENEKNIKKLHIGKTKHAATEGIVAIEEDKKSLYKKGQKNKASETIEVDVPVSKIEDIKIKEINENIETNPNMAVALEAMSESGKLSDAPGTTTQKPVLTTAAPSTTEKYEYIPINFDTIDDINTGLLPSNLNLETAGSEQKQHSRIQIKKGPNGQDYEYEYIYYYYDEDEESKKEGKGKIASTTTAPVHNSHDGPLKADGDNHIGNESKTKNKYSSIDRSVSSTTAPETQNEVLPATAGRGRSRGRNITPAPVPAEEENLDDISVRLPSSTRFPPRGRTLASASSTTYVPEVSSEIARHRGRGQSDSVADESIGQTRSRTRSHVRRPSSELVDLDSFKPNSGDIPSSYKEPPSRYSSESRSTTEEPEAETKENLKESAREGHSLDAITFQEIIDDSKLPADYKKTTVSYEQDTTEYTTMTAMEKVALDLYAYLAGENLNNEINPTNAEPIDFDGTTTIDDSWTTEALTTTEEPTTTSTTTTTTTTTTTEAPTTTTAAPSTRPSRFKGRAGARNRISTTSAATEAPQETSTKARSRFGKPGGRRTPVATVEVSTQASTSNAEKPVQTKPFGRRGLFAGRTRPSTSATAAPAAATQDEAIAPASEAPAPSRTRLRPGLRRGTTTTTTSSAPEDSTSPNASGEVSETTIAPARTLGRSRPGLRPAALRPGPRLNLRPNPRLRPSSAAPAETSEAPLETSAPEALSTDADAEASSPTPAVEGVRGSRLRPNRLQLSPSPKPRVAVAAPPRRPNPLLRRKPSTEATTEAPKKSSAESVEESTASAERAETETEGSSVVETTPAPPLRGLDALIARRRAAGPRPLRPARRAN